MKVITICGSMKYKDEMDKIAQDLIFNGNCVLLPNNISINKESLSNEQIDILKKIHLKKIEISDSILVMDINHYIGESTKKEIEFAKRLNKEIIYYSDKEN